MSPECPRAKLPAELAPQRPGWTGVWVAVLIIGVWGVMLALLLIGGPSLSSPWAWLLALLMTHLYTGLFITAHDAMHGLVAPDAQVNRFMGYVTAGLFAFNHYGRLITKHHQHHDHPADHDDPDWHPGGLLPWYLSFLRQYVTLGQIILMALAFNGLILVFNTERVILYWMAPAILSTLQLFYFGTYLPHRGHHEASSVTRARSSPLGHVRAFLACYFFGYHHEHHALPWLPWYRLPAAREASAKGHLLAH